MSAPDTNLPPGSPENPASAPGGGKPAVDEFAGIPSARRTRHPVLAVAAALFALFLVYKVRHDVTYAVSSSSPTDLGDARALFAQDRTLSLGTNRYVRLAGPADRESALIIDTQGAWTFSQFMRLFGTGNHLFVKRVADPLPIARTERDLFVGRLVALDDLSYAAAIRRHFTENVSATHFFDPELLKVALQRGAVPLVVQDRLGDSIELFPQHELVIDVPRPGAVRIDFPREKVRDLAAARALVEQQGGVVIEAIASPSAPGPLMVTSEFANEVRERALSALGDIDRGVRIRPARNTVRARVGDLTAKMDGLAIHKAGGDPIWIPWQVMSSVRTLAPVAIPPAAYLIVEGDQPRAHLKSLVIVAFLLAFAVANLLALRRPA